MLGKEVTIKDNFGDTIIAYEAGPKDGPYLEYYVKIKRYNPDYGDDKLCKCGHFYYRHFDAYENMAPVGCKYCSCQEFIPAKD